MAKGKNVLTTGEVAKICNVAARTVSKWFDSGQLKGYRIPGSKDRRIPRSELLRFMKVHNIPAAAMAMGNIRILIADSNTEAAEALADTLRSNADYEVETVYCSFDTGMAAQKFEPHVLLINLLAEDIAAVNICEHIRENKDLQTIKVIALTGWLNNAEAAALLKKGFDGFISDIAKTDEIINKIEEATAIIY